MENIWKYLVSSETTKSLWSEISFLKGFPYIRGIFSFAVSFENVIPPELVLENIKICLKRGGKCEL